MAPLLLKYKREALEEGLPLIRPLWLVAGGDAALLVRDEFAIGDEVVVAPVLEQGQTTREGEHYHSWVFSINKSIIHHAELMSSGLFCPS